MKKLFVLIAMLLFTAGHMSAFATDKKDGVKMADGKMWVIKDGKSSEMTQDVTLGDGTKVTANGNVMMKDGSSKIMQNGDWIGMDGKWVNSKLSKDQMPVEKKEKMEKDKM